MAGSPGNVDAPKPESRSPAPFSWGRALLVAAAIIVLIVGPLKLVNRNSPEGRLLAHIPESVREICEAEYTDFLNGIHHVAVEGHAEAIAGFFCHWRGTLPGLEDNISLTYLLFDSKLWMDANYWKLAYGVPKGDDCLIDEIVQYEYSRGGQKAGHVYCNRGYRVFGIPNGSHIIWTDDEVLVLTDAITCFGCDSQPLYQ